MAAALLSGLGHRWGWWSYQTGFLVLKGAAWSGVAAAALSLFALVVAVRGGMRRAVVYGVHGLIIGALVFGVPAYKLMEGRNLPPIHDITTDSGDPPRFVAVLPLRKDAPNSAEYGGAKLAALQQQAYPDLAPAVLELPPRAAFDLALNVARASGWEIVAAAPRQSHRSYRRYAFVRLQGRHRDSHHAGGQRQPASTTCVQSRAWGAAISAPMETDSRISAAAIDSAAAMNAVCRARVAPPPAGFGPHSKRLGHLRQIGLLMQASYIRDHG